MPESDARVTAPQDPANLNDGRSLAYTRSDAYIVISPNCDFVPEPHVGLVQVYMCTDFRYGVHDPIQWPQIFSDDFEYLCAIRRRSPVYERRYSKIWDSPRDDVDFDHLPGIIFKNLGLLSKTWFAPLNQLVDDLAAEVQDFSRDADVHVLHLRRTMLDARDRILHFPSTFRDVCVQLRTVQRYWLMGRAYLDYARLTARTDFDSPMAADTRLMGTFVTHPAALQRLHRAGIPVWHIRPNVQLDDIVVDAVVVTEEPGLVSEPLERGGAPIYSGLVGTALFDAAKVVVALPLPSTQGKGMLKAVLTGVGAVMYHVRGRDKFLDPVHDWMPKRLRAWDVAMTSVDRSGPAKRQDALWGYWTPEPALLLGPQTIERTRRYLLNWLRIRTAWVYLLAFPDSGVTRVPPQWWRDFLNGDVEGTTSRDDTRKAKRLEQVRAVFKVAFDTLEYVPNPRDPVDWFGYRITEPPPSMCSFIVWEVHELGFRYELLALDRILVPCRNDASGESAREQLLSRIFPDHDLYYIRNLPHKPLGLSAELPHSRVHYLEAFRQVLLRWPLCPQAIHAADPLALTTPASCIEDLEVALTSFYVQTFFAYSGRAPIVPHALPEFHGVWPGRQ
ncbi:hypothetical protein K466DRAFT_604136 [Polyporus arcularius HHB13444]|uniref:Uncharacterized protein n=1 Tax=Polyporus arcularius HHB13444 TaxID=1314778 RepID=A0A5C3NWN2_9APHY|nr:hypothetical protein K466DRAFT_604136 [Polyporus arcularius HHB13444]